MRSNLMNVFALKKNNNTKQTESQRIYISKTKLHKQNMLPTNIQYSNQSINKLHYK